MVVALAAGAFAEVVLQVARRPCHGEHRVDRRLRQERAAEIRVQHDAGEVEHRPQ
jgi:hypothetical protein